MSPDDPWEDTVGRVRGEVDRVASEPHTVRAPVTPTEPESVLRVPVDACEPGGHLGPGRCIDLLAHTRMLHLLTFYGVDAVQLARRTGCDWAATACHLRMLRPVRPFDEVRVRTRLVAAGESAIEVESWIVDKPGRVLKVLAWSELEYRDAKTGRPARHPEEIAPIFARALADRVPLGGDLDARAAAIAAELKSRP